MAVNYAGGRTRIAVRSQSIRDAGTKVRTSSGRTFHRSRAACYSAQSIGGKAANRSSGRGRYGIEREIEYGAGKGADTMTRSAGKAAESSAKTAGKTTENSGKTAEKAAETTAKTVGEAANSTAKAAEKAAETVAKAAEKAGETAIRAGSAAATAGTSEAFHAIKSGFRFAKKTFDVSKKGLEKATASSDEGARGGSKAGGMTVSEQNANLTSHKSAKTGTKLLAFFTPLVGAMLLPVMITALLTLMIIIVVLVPILSAAGISAEAHPEVPPVSTEAFSKISEEMLKYQGISYVWGGSSPETGFDCSGLVQYVYRNALGIELPRQSQSMCDFCAYVPEADAAQGDLVFFRGTSARTGNDITHVAIYCGDNIIYEAGDNGVGYARLDTPYSQAHFAGFGRVPGIEIGTVSNDIEVVSNDVKVDSNDAEDSETNAGTAPVPQNDGGTRNE